ncbi:MAG: 50S ribosomal protein L25 [Solirubrobacterales bacterium]|nr:50S ribosomal protein L25 [Solirubrobacterales bacterium]
MASSDRPVLAVEPREERGSRASRRLRRSGLVPGVLYGGSHDEPVSFKVADLELRRILAEGAALIDVEIGGERSVPAILKDRQLHPVRDEFVHVDFLEVNLKQKIHAEVTIELDGADEAPGVREGGILDQSTREVTIEALPTDIPESIHVDVSALDIGASLSLADVQAPAGVEIVHDHPEDVVIASIVLPTKVEEPEEIESETEVVGEEGAAAEGEGGDESAADESGD